MSLPKSAIWQGLRQQALDAVPVGSQVLYRAPATLKDWQARGAYTVPRATKNQLTLLGASVDIGGALMSEAEYLLDHAAEHQAAIWAELSGGRWSSPAWQVVTFYYWAYYLAMALTRMLGDTVWFVNPPVALQLSKLAPSGSRKMGPGTFRVLCGNRVSANDREILLVKSSGRVHEQLWRTWHSVVDARLTVLRRGATDALEERLYLAQQRAAQSMGRDWPSALRNLVNYRPGFAYDAVRRAHVLESFRYLNVTDTYSYDALVGRFENNVIGFGARGLFEEQVKLASRILVDFTFLLHGICTELHREVVDRQKLDRRWGRDRMRFVADQGLARASAAAWPC